VLKEIARVGKPGGKVGIFDGDDASLTLAADEPANAKKGMDEIIINAQVINPRGMREMPRLLREVGLALTSSFGYVVADIGRADFFRPGLEALARLLPKSGDGMVGAVPKNGCPHSGRHAGRTA